MVRLLVSLFGALATIGLIWFSDLPLGIPGEWTWPRASVAADFIWSLIPACFWIAVLGAYVWFGSIAMDDRRQSRVWQQVAWLTGLALVSFGTLGGLRESAPMEYRSAKIALVLYFPGSSGYFTEARKVRSTAEFLSGYSEVVSQGDVLHQGTHPPGLIVGYRGLMWFCESNWLRGVLLATMPSDLREAFRIISDGARKTGGSQLSEHDRCVLWLAGLMMQACAAATVVPLYALLRLHTSRVTTWYLVSFWPLVPAITVFLPKSDVCFPFLGCSVLALWLYGLRSRSSWLCFTAGATFWIGMTLSLALLPVGCLAGLLTIWNFWSSERGAWRSESNNRFLVGLFAAFCGFLTPTLWLWLGTGCNLFLIWGWNLQNHAGFYQQFPRTYWKWLLVNPVELMFALGLPLSLLSISGIWQTLKHPRRMSSGPGWASLMTWVLLWVSGKNSGEAARLWIFLMPWAIWIAADGWDQSANDVTRLDQRRKWALLWGCQGIATLATVSRVVGFHF